MNTKAWYSSKTLWINLVAIIAMLVQTRTGFIIDAETQGGILAVVNLVLRIITSSPLDWGIGSQSVTVAGPGSESTITDPERHNEGGYVQAGLVFMIGSLLLAGLIVNGCATANPAAGTAGTAATAPAETPLQTAGKSLLAVKSSIVTAAIAVDGLCKAGTIGPDKCAQAKDAYELAKPSYDAAVDAYLLWSLGHSDQAGFNAALTRAQSLAVNLLQLSGGAQ